MTRTAWITHRAAVVLMGVGVLVATIDGFAQSYAGLLKWAEEHGLKGWKADSFPLLVDMFIAVGELGLFALALEGHRLTRRGLVWADVMLPFTIAASGWSVSLAFNVGAVKDDLSHQLTASVAPVASMLGLLVLLRTLHRLVTRDDTRAQDAPPGTAVVLASNGDGPADAHALQLQAARVFADDVTAGRVPGVRAIKQQLRVGQDKAREVQSYLTVLANQ